MDTLLSVHIVFDVIAVLSAISAGILSYKWKFYTALEKTAASVGIGYFFALSMGSILGAFVLGTANLYLSGEPLVGRSIIGALLGATITVEAYKFQRGTKGSTGYIYVIPFCVLIIIGRFGCFLSGLDDHTYGVMTSLPLGVDFGDGLTRHPVQLYESLSMLSFAILIVMMMKTHITVVINYGYYLCVGFYTAQRFCWEFLKPYGTVFGNLNIFHIVCLILMIYSIVMIYEGRYGKRAA